MTAQSDAEFLATYDPDAFAHPSLAVDVVLVSVAPTGLVTLLARRAEAPQRGRWALPGGFVGLDESLEGTATRVLVAKTGLTDVALEQLYTFGSPRRDPRTRVVSVAYLALVPYARLAEHVARDAHDLVIARLRDTPAGLVVEHDARTLPLAFDHHGILTLARERLAGQVDYLPVAAHLLPVAFTLRQLQAVHEALAGRFVDRDSFRRRMLATGWFQSTGRRVGGAHRPAELYRLADPPSALVRDFDPATSPEWCAALSSLDVAIPR